MRHEMNSVWYGSSDSCQMASPESFEVWATLRTKIQAEKGRPHPKIEKKNKCVSNWLLGKMQCFLFFSFSLIIARRWHPLNLSGKIH